MPGRRRHRARCAPLVASVSRRKPSASCASPATLEPAKVLPTADAMAVARLGGSANRTDWAAKTVKRAGIAQAARRAICAMGCARWGATVARAQRSAPHARRGDRKASPARARAPRARWVGLRPVAIGCAAPARQANRTLSMAKSNATTARQVATVQRPTRALDAAQVGTGRVDRRPRSALAPVPQGVFHVPALRRA